MNTSPINTYEIPQPGDDPEASKPGHLQKFFPLYILGLLLWLTVGRMIVLGPMGWVTFLIMILGVPSLVIYSGLIYLIVKLRHKSPSPTFTALFNNTMIVILASGYFFGLALGDSGELGTVESPILTIVTGLDIKSLSSTIAILSFLMFVVSSFALLMICVFYRKRTSTSAPTPPVA